MSILELTPEEQFDVLAHLRLNSAGTQSQTAPLSAWVRPHAWLGQGKLAGLQGQSRRELVEGRVVDGNLSGCYRTEFYQCDTNQFREALVALDVPGRRRVRIFIVARQCSNDAFAIKYRH